ncbi:MAG: GNAT family N-acetyltransferase [Caulobacteraceae bacterium]|nr:GNAT family N-acetyltransferase [Caulobacter sp.]
MPASALAEALPRAADPPRRLAQIVLHRDLVTVRSAWEALLAVAPASAYQTPDWVAPWLDALGEDATPLFVVGQDEHGPVALLPLGRTRHCGVAVARFLGGRDSNYGLGLFHPAVAWDAPAVRHLLRQGARLGGIDLFWLANQPHGFAGATNPLTSLPILESPSQQHETPLAGPAETVLGDLLSPRARKHIRQKEAKLAALGPVRHVVARDAATVTRIASTLLAQRAARFGPTGRDHALERFLTTAATPIEGKPPAVELHALSCGETLVAAFAGARHAGRFSGMMVSFAPEPDWARFSPGELLIARIVAVQRRNGATAFDLGIGEARYKDGFCPVTVPLFDTVLGIGMGGRIASLALTAALMAKRRIKRSPALRVTLARWRRLRRTSGRNAALG